VSQLSWNGDTTVEKWACGENEGKETGKAKRSTGGGHKEVFMEGTLFGRSRFLSTIEDSDSNYSLAIQP